MVTPETRLHSLLFGGLVACVVGLCGWAGPYLGDVETLGRLGILLALLLASPWLYRVLAVAALSWCRRWRWLLKIVLGKSFVQGFWVGYIRTSSGRYVMAVEKMMQTPSSLRAEGESYRNLALRRGAEWETNSAAVDPEGSYVYVYYDTTVFCDDSNQRRRTEGFGRLKIDGDLLRGSITDLPVQLRETSEDGTLKSVWRAKGVEYNLRKVKDKKVGSFDEARNSAEWRAMLREAARLDPERWTGLHSEPAANHAVERAPFVRRSP